MKEVWDWGEFGMGLGESLEVAHGVAGRGAKTTGRSCLSHAPTDPTTQVAVLYHHQQHLNSILQWSTSTTRFLILPTIPLATIVHDCLLRTAVAATKNTGFTIIRKGPIPLQPGSRFGVAIAARKHITVISSHQSPRFAPRLLFCVQNSESSPNSKTRTSLLVRTTSENNNSGLLSGCAGAPRRP
jgi:hypothetical protein